MQGTRCVKGKNTTTCHITSLSTYLCFYS